MYSINLRHIFAVTRAFIGPMIEHRRGTIVNVHSVEGMRGYPGEPVYGAMKAAAAHFTTNLAVTYGRYGIRVNGIGPDLTQTPQVDYLTGYEDHDDLWPAWAPVGRLGWPEDQARVALFLASDMSAFVTGHNIPVDGGTKAGGGWFWSPSANRFVNRPDDALIRRHARSHSVRVAGHLGDEVEVLVRMEHESIGGADHQPVAAIIRSGIRGWTAGGADLGRRSTNLAPQTARSSMAGVRYSTGIERQPARQLLRRSAPERAD